MKNRPKRAHTNSNPCFLQQTSTHCSLLLASCCWMLSYFFLSSSLLDADLLEDTEMKTTLESERKLHSNRRFIYFQFFPFRKTTASGQEEHRTWSLRQHPRPPTKHINSFYFHFGRYRTVFLVRPSYQYFRWMENGSILLPRSKPSSIRFARHEAWFNGRKPERRNFRGFYG